MAKALGMASSTGPSVFRLQLWNWFAICNRREYIGVYCEYDSTPPGIGVAADDADVARKVC
jgi:hypothetical protein